MRESVSRGGRSYVKTPFFRDDNDSHGWGSKSDSRGAKSKTDGKGEKSNSKSEGQTSRSEGQGHKSESEGEKSRPGSSALDYVGKALHLSTTISAFRPPATAPSRVEFDPEADFDFESKTVTPDAYETSAALLQFRYRQLCSSLGVVPCSQFLKQIGNTDISLSDVGMGPLELKAAFTLLAMDTELTDLDVSGNRFGRHEVSYLGELLRSNKFLTHLVLANNSLSGEGMEALTESVPAAKRLRSLDLSGNGLCDRDSTSLCRVIEETDCIAELILHHNELGQCGVTLGNAIANNDTITFLNLSWNHIRGVGAVGLAKGVGKNGRLTKVNFAWNGFGYEGCTALAEALRQNSTLQILDLTNNRIHPPALLQLLQGVNANKTLTTLMLGLNPIPAHLTSYMLDSIRKWKHGNLKELDLQGIVVDLQFEKVLAEMQETRMFLVRYDTSLPLQKHRKSTVDPKNVYNIDPLRILFFMKEHLRTIDLFLKIDQNNDGLLTRDEMKYAFELEGYPISDKALDQVMGYLDTNKNGDVDLGEFFHAERRMRREQIRERLAEEDDKKLRRQATQTALTPSNFSQTVSPAYSQTFKKATPTRLPRLGPP